ncbi:MAG TPA: biotin carboxylase N-terminal domain-containing protein [Acidimicrobiales bacterium]|nr:biotin carboxylase N-terminal domain-containing protein [Acidimicrobiales bacterium]
MADVIRRVLVANRGEVARRVFRTCAELGISTVAVYSDPDRSSPYVADADVAVPLGGTSSAESYLDVYKVLAAAARAGADAVHPGYGFLAENAEFAQACVDAGLVWIGPPPPAIRAMARKVEAKDLAAAAGVPLLPSATVAGDDEAAWVEAAAGVGYPLLVKASSGGGGKGMRRVDDVAGLADAVRAGRREAASSFGDPTVFIERYLDSPHHVEVQVLADRHGNVVHLCERDCSVQRRHQKVVEEAPAPGLGDDLRRRLHDAAIALTRAIAYENAGTIEFLVAGDDLFFLEMNTRLQVEHPVTEAILGLDIVRLQLLIADGGRLPFSQEDVRSDGHAVEVRLYAEDPRRDFLPSVGTLVEFRPGATPGIRWDTGVERGSTVTPHYDPMLAKVIAHAPTRTEAARRLARALRGLVVAGVDTNRDALVATLESAAFLDGAVSTGFFDANPAVLDAAPPPDVVRHAAVAAALVLRHRDRPVGPLAGVAPVGWRNVPSVAAARRFSSFDGTDLTVELPPGGAASGTVAVAGEPVGLSTDAVDDGGATTVVDGLRRRFTVTSDGETHWIAGDEWHVRLVEHPRFADHSTDAGAAGLEAPLPGTIVAIEVEPGQEVRAGGLLLVVEAMKMEHRIVADADARVTAVLVAVGDRVEAHQPLVTLARDGESP